MANTFIIDPSSVNVEDIKADIKAFLDAAPDTAKWKDYFTSGVGQTQIELVAGLGALIAYNVIVGRREGFIQYARNRASIIGASQTLGYSSYRGRNAVLKLTITPSTTALLTKYQVVGSVKDLDLLMAEDTAVNAGVTTEIRVIVGTLKEEEFTINTAGPGAFRFTKDRVSSDVRLFLGNSEVEISERMLDLTNEKFVLLSNVLGSVDVYYLNLISFMTRYNVGDILKLQWVELQNVTFVETDVKYDLGTLVSFLVESNFQDLETAESIQVNAPMFHETQFVIRGRDDYSKAFKLLNVGIKNTDYTDVSAGVVDLCYAQYASCLFTDAELAQFVTQLSAFRAMGLQPPTISHPLISFLDLNVDIKLLNNSGDPTTSVEAIMAEFENVLKQKVSFADLEQMIEALSFVKIARVTYATTPWTASNTYRLGKHVTISPDNGKIYKVNDFVYKSTSVEPTWPTTLPLGQTVIDGRIVWELVAQPEDVPAAWQANTRYKIGDYVAPTAPISIPNPPSSNITAAFRVKAYINRSRPDTPAIASAANYNGTSLAWGEYDGTRYVGSTDQTLIFDGVQTVQQVAAAAGVAFYPPANNLDVPPAGSLNLTGAGATNLDFTANTPGSAGDNIVLGFDGIKKVSEVVSDYNVSHPGNTVGFTGDGNAVLPLTGVQLTGGADLVSGEPVWPGSILPPC